MKQTWIITFFFSILAISSPLVKAQTKGDEHSKYTFGIGLQYSSPVWGISGKYALSEHSVLHGIVDIISPIVKLARNSASSTYYGMRYVYRFNSGNKSHPYAFGGLGLMTWTAGADFTGNWTDAGSTTFRYNAGGGYEWIVAENLGISGEVSFGSMSTDPSDGQVLHRPAIGIGLHYYAHSSKKSVKAGSKNPRQLD